MEVNRTGNHTLEQSSPQDNASSEQKKDEIRTQSESSNQHPPRQYSTCHQVPAYISKMPSLLTPTAAKSTVKYQRRHTN
jgi:hypothetical protein